MSYSAISNTIKSKLKVFVQYTKHLSMHPKLLVATKNKVVSLGYIQYTQSHTWNASLVGLLLRLQLMKMSMKTRREKFCAFC